MVSAPCLLAACVIASNESLQNALSPSVKATKAISVWSPVLSVYVTTLWTAALVDFPVWLGNWFLCRGYVFHSCAQYARPLFSVISYKIYDSLTGWYALPSVYSALPGFSVNAIFTCLQALGDYIHMANTLWVGGQMLYSMLQGHEYSLCSCRFKLPLVHLILDDWLWSWTVVSHPVNFAHGHIQIQLSILILRFTSHPWTSKVDFVTLSESPFQSWVLALLVSCFSLTFMSLTLPGTSSNP